MIRRHIRRLVRRRGRVGALQIVTCASLVVSLESTNVYRALTGIAKPGSPSNTPDASTT